MASPQSGACTAAPGVRACRCPTRSGRSRRRRARRRRSRPAARGSPRVAAAGCSPRRSRPRRRRSRVRTCARHRGNEAPGAIAAAAGATAQAHAECGVEERQHGRVVVAVEPPAEERARRRRTTRRARRGTPTARCRCAPASHGRSGETGHDESSVAFSALERRGRATPAGSSPTATAREDVARLAPDRLDASENPLVVLPRVQSLAVCPQPVEQLLRAADVGAQQQHPERGRAGSRRRSPPRHAPSRGRPAPRSARTSQSSAGRKNQ